MKVCSKLLNLALLLFVAGCAFTRGEIALYTNKVPEADIDVSVIQKRIKENKSRHSQTKDCIDIYVIFPNKLRFDQKKLLDNLCKENEFAINISFSDHLYYIPLIYGQECYQAEATCVE